MICWYYSIFCSTVFLFVLFLLRNLWSSLSLLLNVYCLFSPLAIYTIFSLFLNNSFFMFHDVICFMLLVWGDLLNFLGHSFGIFLPTNTSCYFYILISLISFGNCSYLYTQTLRLSHRSLTFNILDYFFLFGFT